MRNGEKMSIEQDIAQLKEAFREYIKLKIEEESQKEMDNGNHSDKWSAESVVGRKYKPVFDALDGYRRY